MSALFHSADESLFADVFTSSTNKSASPDSTRPTSPLYTCGANCLFLSFFFFFKCPSPLLPSFVG